MSLYKRGNVWWEYFYIDGIRHQLSTETGNRRLAERIAAKLRQEAILRKHQLVQADPDMTFSELATRFMTEAGPTEYHLGRLEMLLPFFGERPVQQITKALVHEYRVWRHRQRALKKQSAIKDATVNRDVSVLRHILYWALDEQLLATNPLSRIRLVRERRTKRSVLGIAEEPLLLAACAPHLREIAIVAVDTGMRRGEITHQRWEDVDLERNLLVVTRSKTPEGESREIPMTRRVHDLLESRKQSQGLVYTYNDQTLKRLKTGWKGALRRSGIRRLRFHDLRHTFGTRLMEAGVVQDVRKSLMGHSSGGVHSSYIHVELPDKRKAIAALEAWIQAQTQELKQKELKQKEQQKGGNANGRDSIRADQEGNPGERANGSPGSADQVPGSNGRP